ncbi:hypothetical protein BRADI_3g34355v3 [Brachypodium distachyon]|uniref:Uncharacterized protein n=1 Tax=Brachypodium distachyon TaxID=15368 RepID=A0A2K2D113_BRADI|nr:hypothetical protein BRADI_3g34355v3 [Brachypodium distachyon]
MFSSWENSRQGLVQLSLSNSVVKAPRIYHSHCLVRLFLLPFPFVRCFGKSIWLAKTSYRKKQRNYMSRSPYPVSAFSVGK